MVNLNRVRVQLDGFEGGPGLMTFYTLDTATFLESLHTLLTGLASNMPAPVRMTIVPFGDVIESTTGDLVGAWGGTAQAVVQGVQGGAYSAPTGAIIRWATTTILDGHRVRGRTFIVPLTGAAFASNGQLVVANQNSMDALASQFSIEQNASFVIWHRPFAGRAASPGVTAKPAHLGGHALVTGASISSKAAVLRSRRD